jgi:hypothetical protein
LIFDVETTEQILKIPETQFERYFKHWQEWWNRSVHSEQAYFECD